MSEASRASEPDRGRVSDDEAAGGDAAHPPLRLAKTSRYKRYPKYKDSGIPWIGEVPEGWNIVPVAAIAVVQSGCPFNSDQFESTGNQCDRVIRMRDLLADDQEIYTREHCPEDAIVYDGDILLGISGEFNIRIWQSQPAKLNQRVCLVRGRHAEETQYLGYFLQPLMRVLHDRTQSTTVKNLSPDELLHSQISIPPGGTLDTIVAFLDRETGRINALTAKKTRFIELLKEKRQVLITHAVTKGLDPNVKMKDSGVPWIGKVPDGWGVYRLKHVLSQPLQYGANQSGQDGEGVRYIRITDLDQSGNLTDEPAKYLPEAIAAPYLLRAGDILFARSGATVGKTYLHSSASSPACFAGYLIMARPASEVVLPRFAISVVRSHYYWAYIGQVLIQATIENVSAERYGDFPLATPPLPEQSAIVAFLDRETTRIDGLIAKTEQSIALLKERRSALITAAVTGQIDMRGEVA